MLLFLFEYTEHHFVFKNGVVGNVGQGSMICEMGNRVTGEIGILVLELVLGSKVLISSETRAPKASYRTLVLLTDGAKI